MSLTTALSSTGYLSLRLPTTLNDVDLNIAPTPRRRRWRPRLSGHRSIFILALLVCCIFLALRFAHLLQQPPSFPRLPVPVSTPAMPLDRGMHAIAGWEQDLPGNIYPPEEPDMRYIRFLNENWGVGFNNQLQEIIFHAHLAHLSNRTYILPPVNFPHSEAWHPLAAFVRGSLAGSPTIPSSPLRAVTRDHFHRACPDWESAPSANYTALAARLSPEFKDHQVNAANQSVAQPGVPNSEYATLTAEHINNLLGLEAEPAGDILLHAWTRVLSSMSERCLTIRKDSAHVFDFDLFGSPRVQSIIPGLLCSPVLQDLHWSPLVHGAAERNLRRWGWTTPDSARNTSQPFPDTNGPLPRVLALHLRRGDYLHHCTALSAWNSAFLGVNEALMIPDDRFVPPDHGNTTPEQRASFARRCWPELQDILARVRQVRDSWRKPDVSSNSFWRGLQRVLSGRPRNKSGAFSNNARRLNRIYILTNGSPAWYASLRAALLSEGWDDVRGSPEMDFGGEEEREWEGPQREAERVVGQSVDMEIAQRAEVFVGNGFSSLTANVNLLRLVHGAERDSIRFW